MAIPRSDLIRLDATAYYHVMNRCVRRSYLSGIDPVSSRDYSHRKHWIVNRMKLLANIFAINICAHAVLSNHYHLVLWVNEEEANQWTDAEVIQRWASIFKKDAARHQHIASKIELWRERLTNISWYMRCLNEYIAKAANDEDELTGRFWEGRFKSQALLDENALLTAMAYVDLNPIRAGIANTPEESEFTSIYERIQYIQTQIPNSSQIDKADSKFIDQLNQPTSLVPLYETQPESAHVIQFKLSDYLQLVDTTGRIIRQDKQAGSIPEHLAPILKRLSINQDNWIPAIKQFGTMFYRAIGSEVVMVNFSADKTRTIKGTRSAKLLYTQRR